MLHGFQDVDARATDLDGTVADPTDFSELNKTQIGWAAGAGVEYGVAPNWSVKLKYLFMDFGKDTSTNIDGDQFTHRNSVHTAKVGFNWYFGSGPAVTARY